MVATTPADDFLATLRTALSQVRAGAQDPAPLRVTDRTGRLRLTLDAGTVAVEIDRELVEDDDERARTGDAVREAVTALLAGRAAAVQVDAATQERLSTDAQEFFAHGQDQLSARLREVEERFGRFRRE